MADDPMIRTASDTADPTTNEAPVPQVADPGGAHSKGYSADPDPAPRVPAEGPLPLADAPDVSPAIHVPERDPHHAQPTGRQEPGEYTPNDRLMGADR